MKKSSPQNKALERVAAHVGNQVRLAEIHGLHVMTISHWKNRGVPPERCMQLSALSGYTVKVHELRPDILPAPGSRAA